MCMACLQFLWTPEEGIRAPGTEVTDDIALPCVCWEPKPDPGSSERAASVENSWVSLSGLKWSFFLFWSLWAGPGVSANKRVLTNSFFPKERGKKETAHMRSISHRVFILRTHLPSRRECTVRTTALTMPSLLALHPEFPYLFIKVCTERSNGSFSLRSPRLCLGHRIYFPARIQGKTRAPRVLVLKR